MWGNAVYGMERTHICVILSYRRIRRYIFWPAAFQSIYKFGKIIPDTVFRGISDTKEPFFHKKVKTNIKKSCTMKISV